MSNSYMKIYRGVSNEMKLFKTSLFNFTSKSIKPSFPWIRNKCLQPYEQNTNYTYKYTDKDIKKLERIEARKARLGTYKIYYIYEGDTVQVIDGDFKGQVGKVISLRRRANKCKVKGVNPIAHTMDPDKLRNKYDNNDDVLFPKKFYFGFISLKSVRLVSPFSNKKIIPLIHKDEEGNRIRMCPDTKLLIPFPKKEYKSREEKYKDWKDGAKDTPVSDVNQITYRGINYCQVARDFLNRIKEKEEVEKQLILKEKIKLDF